MFLINIRNEKVKCLILEPDRKIKLSQWRFSILKIMSPNFSNCGECSSTFLLSPPFDF